MIPNNYEIQIKDLVFGSNGGTDGIMIADLSMDLYLIFVL